MVNDLNKQEAKDECGNQVEPPGMHVIYLPYADDVRYPEENLFAKGKPKKGESESPRPHFCSEDQLAEASAVVDALYLEDFEVGSVQNPALQVSYLKLFSRLCVQCSLSLFFFFLSLFN